MVAFRFLALLTVGLSLLTFVFLLNVSNARLEREALRQVVGAPFQLEAGGEASWTLDLGGTRVETAWPGEQRQPRLFVRAEPGAELAARAEYRSAEGVSLLQALSLFMKLSTAVDVSSLVFALNHMNARAFAHLFIVGWLWSIFYIKSKNLMVPVLIHMMWNGRTFMAPI